MFSYCRSVIRFQAPLPDFFTYFFLVLSIWSDSKCVCTVYRKLTYSDYFISVSVLLLVLVAVCLIFWMQVWISKTYYVSFLSSAIVCPSQVFVMLMCFCENLIRNLVKHIRQDDKKTGSSVEIQLTRFVLILHPTRFLIYLFKESSYYRQLEATRLFKHT